MKKKTLVLGASENPERYSNKAIRMLRNKGIPVVAHGRKKGVVENVTIETDLQDWEGIDTVTLYLNPKNQEPYYDFLLKLHPNRVIFNPGTENPILQQKLSEHQISYEEACTLVLLSTNQYQ